MLTLVVDTTEASADEGCKCMIALPKQTAAFARALMDARADAHDVYDARSVRYVVASSSDA